MPLLFSHGVQSGRISIEQFVALTSTNAARMYGLYPQKGSIAIGADADLVIWDGETERTIRNDDLHHNVDYTPYEGIQLNAWPAATLSRGRVLWQDGQYLGQPGLGRFLPCQRPEPAQPKVTQAGFTRVKTEPQA